MLAALATRGLPPGEHARYGVTAIHGLAMLAFMARDLGVIAFFRLGPRAHRGDFGAVVALVLIYTVGVIAGGTLGGDHGAALFAPVPTDPLVSLGSGLVQAALAWWLAAGRIRAPEGRFSASAPSGPASAPAS
jgi:hypothetical protein